ncbi:MAG: hypothetical protein ACYC4L_11470 [Chloroflexota bacterium]
MSRRRNPDVLGHPIGQLAEVGLGAAGTVYMADNLAVPLARQFLPGMSGAMLRAVEAVATGVAAWALGAVVGMADRRIGRQVEYGGGVVTIARGVGIVIPNYGLTATLPFSGNIFAGILPQAKATPAVTANGSQQALGVGSMGL